MSVDSATLPNHLTEADVRAAATEAGTLLDAQRLLRLDRGRTKRLLRDRGLLEDVQRADPEFVEELRNQEGRE